MQAANALHVYVDFRAPDTPPGKWYRVIAVTHSWVRAQLADPGSSHSRPATLIVPDGSLESARLAIDSLLSQGGATLVAREAKLIADDERVSVD